MNDRKTKKQKGKKGKQESRKLDCPPISFGPPLRSCLKGARREELLERGIQVVPKPPKTLPQIDMK